MKRRMRAGWAAVLVVASVVGGALVASGPAGATTTTSVVLYVQKNATGNLCTSATPCGYVGTAVFVAEVIDAGDDVTITVGPGTYTDTYTFDIGSGDASLTIEGAGAGHTGSILEGDHTGPIFTIEADGHPVTIEGLTIADGGSDRGGGVYIESPHVSLSHDTFSTDSAEYGGGVFVTGWDDVTISDDTFKSDDAEYGGAVLLTTVGTATVVDDTFTHDHATRLGGALFSYESTTSVFNSTFFDDEGDTGGALANIRSTVLVVDTTIATDSAGTTGGGIYTSTAGVEVYGSILSNATCGGTTGLYRPAYDVESGDTCDFGPTSVNTSATIGLHRLAANTSTGPETMAIGPTSSAFELVPLAACGTPDTDERGAPRPGIATETCDAGAYEYQTGTVFTTTSTASNVLYVRSGATGASCTAPTSAKACGTIEAAVSVADDGSGTTTITVGPGTYPGGVTVTATGLRSLTIDGAGASSTAVTDDGHGRDFTVTGGTVTISGLSIDGGHATNGTGGGITHSNGGTITLTKDTFSDDSATGTGAYGGGLFNHESTAVLVDDTFSDDSADTGGAMTNTEDATATLTNVTFVDDSAEDGGALGNYGSVATLTDDTFYDDSAGTGGAVGGEDSTATVSASIFDVSSCGRTVSFSGSYDVTTTASCNFGPTDETVTTTSLDLAPTLEANGSTGPETLAIGPGSAAFEVVPPVACTVHTDERGEPRPGVPGASCDAGAYEYQGQAVTSASCPATSAGCNTNTSRPGRSVSAATTGVKVTGSGGRATVGVGTYRHDPYAALPGATGKFFGVSLSSDSTLKTLVVTVCGVGSGTTLEWWNGSAWQRVAAPTSVSSGAGGSCLSVTLGPATTPSLSAVEKLTRMSRLQSVVFGVVH